MNRKYVRRSDSQWHALFEQYATSGQTQQTFCKEQGIAVATFSARRSRDKRIPAPESTSAFVQVKVEQPAHDSSVAIYLGDDVCVQCPSTMSVDALAQLAKSLHNV